MEITNLQPLSASAAKASPRGRPSGVSGIRSHHHRMAELIAAGYKLVEVAAILGRSPATIQNWLKSPANQELVSQKETALRGTIQDILSEEVSTITKARSMAWEMIQARLIEAQDSGDPIPLPVLLSIAGDTSDRTGLGRQQTQVNINVGIGAELDKRRERRLALEQGMVDVTPPAFRRRA